MALSGQLGLEFGKGVDERNLNSTQAYYRSFPIWNAVRTELRWTHYRIISMWKKLAIGCKTIGIILRTEKDETIAKYSVLAENEYLFASKYRLYLPKEEELKQIIEQDRITLKLDYEDK